MSTRRGVNGLSDYNDQTNSPFILIFPSYGSPIWKSPYFTSISASTLINLITNIKLQLKSSS